MLKLKKKIMKQKIPRGKIQHLRQQLPWLIYKELPETSNWNRSILN